MLINVVLLCFTHHAPQHNTNTCMQNFLGYSFLHQYTRRLYWHSRECRKLFLVIICRICHICPILEGIHVGANQCRVCIRTRANTGKHSWQIVYVFNVSCKRVCHMLDRLKETFVCFGFSLFGRCATTLQPMPTALQLEPRGVFRFLIPFASPTFMRAFGGFQNKRSLRSSSCHMHPLTFVK